MVGDPKQSIYRFRRADIAVYDQVSSLALAGGETQIATNFRSNPQLLATLNHVFDHLLVQQPAVQPANVRLEAPPGAEAAKRPPRLAGAGEVEGTANDTRVDEARAIIAGILTPRCSTAGRYAIAVTGIAGGRAGGATWRS